MSGGPFPSLQTVFAQDARPHALLRGERRQVLDKNFEKNVAHSCDYVRAPRSIRGEPTRRNYPHVYYALSRLASVDNDAVKNASFSLREVQ